MYVVEENERCRASSKPLKCLENVDIHHLPYYISCSPCALDFDFMIKVMDLVNLVKTLYVSILRNFGIQCFRTYLIYDIKIYIF